MSLVEKIKLVEEIVRAPHYNVAGYTYGKLVYTTTEEGVACLWSLDTSSGLKTKLADNVYMVGNIVPKSPLAVFTKDVSRGREQQRAYLVDVRNGKLKEIEEVEPRRITEVCFDGETVALSTASEEVVELWIARPDGSAEKVYQTRNILFASSIYHDKIVGTGVLKGDPKTYEIFIYDLDSGEFKIYTPKEGATNRSPKLFQEKMLFTTTAFGGEKLLIYDLDEKRLEEPKYTYRDYEKFDFTEYVLFDWFGDGQIWFIGKRDGRTKAFVDGRLIPLPEGFIHMLTVAEDKVYASHSSLTEPRKVYMIDLTTGEVKTVLSAELSSRVKAHLGRAYLSKYKSFDGLEITAYILESADTSKPGPCIVYVHGGPWAEVADRWDPFIASLAACGYHVVAPNFRGSTGYGEEFRRMDIGDPGGGDLMDVVYAAEWARNNRLASKVAILGYSYGGFMTFLATVKRPDVWDAGVAGAGITDWEEMYELGDALFKRFVEVLFGEKRELWRERSAAYFAENLKAPLCIVHPQNDTRTPLKPVLKYAAKLLELGKTFELHVLPEVGHAMTRTDDVFKISFPAILFLEKYIST
ncbi:S9 family peptidase [Candidatus Bathyarchaeota archaeon]|nr:S9 family peptidase [Candidatus Bathyarchaeota archaeon]